MKEFRRIDIYKVRHMCITNNLYTCGTNEEYDAMFARCRKPGHVTTTRILFVARDILIHSDSEKLMSKYGCDWDEMLAEIACWIANDCCTTVFI